MRRGTAWAGFWLDDDRTRPGKSHIFVRQSYGGIGQTALCGFTPRAGAVEMYHDNDLCQRCAAAKDKRDDLH